MTELKPCPFCGGEAHVVEGMYSSYQEGYAVRCRHCALTLGASGRLGECYEWSCCYKTEAEAIEAWNTRAERTCHVVKNSRKYVLSDGTELFDDGCSICNGYIGAGENYCSNCGAKVVDK